MANEDYKNGKLVEIVREFNNTGNQYEVNGIKQAIAVPFWRRENDKFQVIPKGSYSFINEAGNDYLKILDSTILQQATQFQIVYDFIQLSSKYIEDFPDVVVLTEKYNQLVDDTTNLFSYLKSVGMISDTLQLTKVLAQLEPLTTWYMNENGEIKALPISELYEKFGKLIKAMEKVLDEYIEQKKEEIRGPAGAIDNVTASVNSNAGTPKVTVSLGGTPERRNIDLKFENLKGDKPIKGTDYYTEQEKEQFTTEMVGIVKTEGNKVVEQVKTIVAGNPATTNALTLSGKTRVEFEQDTENLRKEVIDIKKDIKEFSLKTISEPMENTSGIVVNATKGGYGTNSGTTSYLLDFKENTTLYFGKTTAPYLSIVMIENPVNREWEQSGPNYYTTGSSAVRKRNTENNLPNISSPYTTSNAIVIITITANHDVPVFMTSKDKTLSKDIFLNDNHLLQISETLNSPKSSYIQYVPVDKKEFPNSYNKEQLDIYIPTKVGYIKYCFLRNELDSYNANNWRLDKAFAYDEKWDKRFLVVNSGEYEMALQLEGRSDFIGGIAHGDEVLNSITFLIDGNKIKDISSLTTVTKFETLRIIETTTLYDPNDKATLTTNNKFNPIAIHGKEYIITKDGIRLKQFVKWLKNVTLTASYMTMLPIVRGNDSVSDIQITDTFYADDDYILYNVSTNVGASGNAWAWRKDCNRCVIYSDKSGVCADVEMIKQPQIINNGARQFKVQDSSAYNKLYWSVCGVGGDLYNTSVNERFETDTVFKIGINK